MDDQTYRDYVNISNSLGNPISNNGYLEYAKKEYERISNPASFGSPTPNDGNYLRWISATKSAKEAYIHALSIVSPNTIPTLFPEVQIPMTYQTYVLGDISTDVLLFNQIDIYSNLVRQSNLIASDQTPILNSLNQIKESYGRNDLTLAQAQTQFTNIVNGQVVTKESIEAIDNSIIDLQNKINSNATLIMNNLIDLMAKTKTVMTNAQLEQDRIKKDLLLNQLDGLLNTSIPLQITNLKNIFNDYTSNNLSVPTVYTDGLALLQKEYSNLLASRKLIITPVIQDPENYMNTSTPKPTTTPTQQSTTGTTLQKIIDDPINTASEIKNTVLNDSKAIAELNKVPVWMLAIVGLSIAGGIAYVFTRKKKVVKEKIKDIKQKID